ncbi:MAG: hypothetical protein Q7R53_02875 [bacterium]|nr:hypothetical protein [bacterium]
MTFQEAEKIVGVYGKFLEYAFGRFNLLFFGRIPESFLPYSKEYLSEALNIVAKDYQSKGDQKHLQLIREVSANLMGFIDDEKALLWANECFLHDERKNLIIESIKEFQYTWARQESVSGFFKDTLLEKMDFENQDIVTADKISKIYNLFIGYTHMKLSLIFGEKIPESLLPLPKKSLLNTFELLTKYYNSIGDSENAELYFNCPMILEDYIDDEKAIIEVIEKLSDESKRGAIISSMKEFQYKWAKSEYVANLFSELR